MEEDAEIEMLLKDNEEVLMEAAQMPRDGNSEEIDYDQHIYGYKSSNHIESLKYKSDEIDNKEDVLLSQQHLSMANTTKNGNEDVSNNDEIQELLDDQLVLCITERPTKHVLHKYSMSSDEDEERNEYDSDEGDQFINEIAGNNELYGGVFMEHVNKVVKTKNKQVENSAVSDLIALHKLVVKRDHVLKNFELKLKERLDKIEEAMKKIRDSISSLSAQDDNKIKMPNLSRYYFKKFGKPYFKDNRGFTSNPNKDHAKKLRNFQAKLMFLQKPLYWVMPHQDQLLNAVRETLVVENTVKLIKQIDNIKEEMNKCPSKSKDKELIKKLTNYQEELSNLTSKSAEELIAAEDPDRDYDWMKYSVSLFNGEHSYDECKRFWHVYLKPSINKSKWSSTEDLRLTEIAEEMNFENWDSIAKKLGTNRSAYQCIVHFQTRLNSFHEFSRGKWTKEEDEKLLALINQSKIGDFIPWTKVSCHMGDRSQTQIYNRYRNSLNPKLIKGRFTRGEDLLIAAGIEVFGCNYNELSSLIINRSATQIRERYERYLLPKTSKLGSFTLEEDEKLLRLVEKYGDKNWTVIANEIKTRSRTQVRQRYRLIQRNMISNPEWSISDTKRRNIQLVDKNIGITERSVRKIKKEIDEVEQRLNLTKLEKDTFRIEKLKELRDTVLLRKYNVRSRKKSIVADCKAMIPIKTKLTEYFHQNQIKSPNCTNIGDNDDYKSYFNELLLLAKYFGHDLQLPEGEEEIKSNPRLSSDLKKVLLKSKTTTDDVIESKQESHFIPSGSSGPNIDYIPPQTDTSIIMNEWWFNPPFDIRRLNFNEIFKRTVFDYSYGIHQDIWLSKLKRSPQINFSDCVGELPSYQPQVYNMPPNYLTCLGLKSILLSRKRLRRECKKEMIEDSEGLKTEDDINKSLHQFQETVETLFTWPRTLSLNSVSSNPLIKSTSEKIAHQQRIKLNQRSGKLSNPSQDPWLQDLKNVEKKKNAKDQQVKVKRSILEQHQDLKRKARDSKKGFNCKRKMKIEHLVKEEVGKSQSNKKSRSRSNVKIPLSDINFTESTERKMKYNVISSKSRHTKVTGSSDGVEPSTSGIPPKRPSANTKVTGSSDSVEPSTSGIPPKRPSANTKVTGSSDGVEPSTSGIPPKRLSANTKVTGSSDGVEPSTSGIPPKRPSATSLKKRKRD